MLNFAAMANSLTRRGLGRIKDDVTPKYEQEKIFTTLSDSLYRSLHKHKLKNSLTGYPNHISCASGFLSCSGVVHKSLCKIFTAYIVGHRELKWHNGL